MKIKKLGFVFSILLMHSFVVLSEENEDQQSDFFRIARVLPINDKTMDREEDIRQVYVEGEVVHKYTKKMTLPSGTLLVYCAINSEWRVAYFFRYASIERTLDLPARSLKDFLEGETSIFCPNVTQDGNGAIILICDERAMPCCEEFKQWLAKYHPEIK